VLDAWELVGAAVLAPALRGALLVDDQGGVGAAVRTRRSFSARFCVASVRDTSGLVPPGPNATEVTFPRSGRVAVIFLVVVSHR
jgi:hypothetical protein